MAADARLLGANVISIGLQDLHPPVKVAPDYEKVIGALQTREAKILAARALAFIRGRSYVLPQEVLDMALDVMRHRLVLSFEAMSDGVTSDMINSE